MSHSFLLLNRLLHDHSVSQYRYYEIAIHHGYEMILLQIKFDVRV